MKRIYISLAYFSSYMLSLDTEVKSISYPSPTIINEPSKAYKNMTITMDQHIPVFLEHDIDSEINGRVNLILPLDVYSKNGKYLLLPAYTRITCYYYGLSDSSLPRIDLQCSRLSRPDGLSAKISGAYVTDGDGIRGVHGDIRKHINKRPIITVPAGKKLNLILEKDILFRCPYLP